MLRILIINQEEEDRAFLRRIIQEQRLGMIVAETSNVLLAQRIIQDSQPDLVILDQLLPDQNSENGKKNFVRNGLSPAYILIPPARTQEIITEAYQAGIDFCIRKPIIREEVVSLVNQFGERRHFQELLALTSLDNNLPINS